MHAATFALAIAIAMLAPGAPPSTGPNPSSVPTSATQPHHIVPPPGFVLVDAANQIAICAATDAGWVKDVLASRGPATRSASSVEALSAGLKQHRGALRQLLVDQLALQKPAAADAFIDQKLVSLLDEMRKLRVHLVYLVLTQPTLKHLVINGWGSDQFHYNRAADKVIFDGEVSASISGASGDSLVPALYKPDDSPADKIAALSTAVNRTEAGVEMMIDRETQSVFESTVGEFVLREALLPMKLDNDQDWFDAGVVGVLAARSLAIVTGQPETDLVARLSQPSRGNPVPLSSIDLAHPVPHDGLRPQIVNAYADSYRRRSVKTIAAWLAAAGPDGLPKTLTAIREQHPSDNTALLALVQKQTKIDLTPKLAAGATP